MNLPTRTDIAAVLATHKGEGKAAMRTAIAGMKASHEGMTDDHVHMIQNDLLSYSDFTEEEKE